MSQNYVRLPWQQFAVQLVETGDLDPVYILLHRAGLPGDVLRRWLLAYWCFYNAGVASFIAEHPSSDFFNVCRRELASAPRGFERRHFRAENAKKCIKWLEEFGDPEQIVDWIAEPETEGVITFTGVSERVQQMYLFGPWIAWKIGDMLERVMGLPIDFTGTSLNIYEEPRKGAALILHGDPEAKISDGDMSALCVRIEEFLSNHKAPPKYDRPINIQEVETVLCKFKAHVNGHYPLFNDSRELVKALPGWGDLATSLIQYVPGVPETTGRLF